MQTNKNFVMQCLTADVTTTCMPHTFYSRRPRVDREGQMVSVRDFICRARRGDPESEKLVPYVTCGNPNCYNPEHTEWMEPGRAGALALKAGRRTEAKTSLPKPVA